MSIELMSHLLTICSKHINAGAYDKAEAVLKQVYKIQTNNVEAMRLRAIILAKQNNAAKALKIIDKVLNIYPNLALHISTKALILQEMGEYQKALDLFLKAASIDPNEYSIQMNIGTILQVLNRHNEALAYYDKAIELNKNFADSYSNKANALNSLGLFAEAELYYQKAIELDGVNTNAIYNYALQKLLCGDFLAGFDYYEARWFRPDAPPYLHSEIPRLPSLDSIKGKKILVWAEQGYGDTIQFCRYINELNKLGARIIFEVQPLLHHLLRNLNAILIQRNDPYEDIDYQIPLISLPLFFKTSLETIPSLTPYLSIDPDTINNWNKRLNLCNTKLNIGIACSGSKLHKNDKHRSVNLSLFEPLTKIADLFLIQTDLRVSDAEFIKINHGIHYLGAAISDFSDTAAIVKNMDLIISVDTSLVHLSAALNQKTFVLLPYIPDWRWLLGRDSSPWYPSMKLFRQQSAGDWKGVMESIVNEVQLIAKNK